jgi:putative transposase
MDECTREGLAIEVATALPSARVVAVLERLVTRHGTPRFSRRDHGPECIALGLRGWLAQPQTRALSLDPGGPWQNGLGERVNGTVRDEGLNRHAFHAVAEARIVLAADRRQDHEERPHRRVGYRTPTAFKRDGLERQSLAGGLSPFPWPRLLGAGQLHVW